MKNPQVYLGVMSGTSLDGIDVVAFDVVNRHVIAAHSLDFSNELRQKTMLLQHSSDDELHLAQLVSNELANLYSQTINVLLEKYALNRKHVLGVGVHGQTIRHRPELGYTIQLNQPARIAEQTQLTVVSDFRSRDIAAGGQGAPLVPAFHDAIWRVSDQNRVILNVGGFANISILNQDQPVFGYDTGPANVLMDAWIHQNKSLNYDKNGDWATSGTIHQGLLEAFMKETYFLQPPPKSTGRDSFHLNWLHSHLYAFEPMPAANVQATLLELTARTICNEILRSSPNIHELIVCGGGAFNTALLNRLQQLLSNCTVFTSNHLGIHPQHVEAAAFAWLAYRTLNQLSGNLPDVTGAIGERILGNISFA